MINKKSNDFNATMDEPKILTQSFQNGNTQEKQEQKENEWSELKMSYNQKLLKSIEKKTMKENKFR